MNDLIKKDSTLQDYEGTDDLHLNDIIGPINE